MMNVSRKKLLFIRFLINPISVKTQNPNSLISSTASSLSSSIIPSLNTAIYNPNYAFLTHRCFSIVSDDNSAISSQNLKFGNTRTLKLKTTDTRNPKLVSELIDMIRTSKGECRSKLNSIDTRLSKPSICEIIRVLSFEKVPALQFFEWVRVNDPDVYRNSDVCSLMVDNCGWLNDYDTMRALLIRFTHEQICLNDKAFGFLPVLDSTKARAMECISLVVRVLGEVGGSVNSSGVYALISMLCAMDLFELAKYVMEVTEKKTSYYAILVRDKCRRGCTDEAYGLIKQMRTDGSEDCGPDVKMYNYVLSSLCKVDKLPEALSLFEEMKGAGVDPDEITFEIFITYACRVGKMEFANESFERLMETGRQPRVSTCAAIVKGYFNAGRYEEAYAYVCGIEVKRMSAVHKLFSLLARLHQKKGNVEAARRILDEMMEKGLKPDFLHFAKTVNVLRRVGGNDLARDLRNKYSKFRVE